jgi:Zn-dependent M32 family carboxypeptidase
VPGTYQVRLTVDGQSQTQSFEVLPDPRIAVSPEDLTAQRDMLLSIRDSLTRTNKAVNALDVVAAQVALWTERTTDPAVSAAAGDITSELRAIRAKLIDVNMKQAQLWPSGLHEKFNALFDSVDGADYAPPQQARDVYADLNAQLDELIGKLRDIDKTRMAKLNEMIQAAGLFEVGVDR